MKKFLVFILSLIYMTVSIGTTVHLHYCMDKLVEWNLGNKKTNAKICSYCGMAKTKNGEHCGKQDDGCCKDEQKQVKIEKDQKIAGTTFNFENPLSKSFVQTPVDFSSFEITSPVIAYSTAHAPPQTENIPLFLRNCIFRI